MGLRSKKEFEETIKLMRKEMLALGYSKESVDRMEKSDREDRRIDEYVEAERKKRNNYLKAWS